MKKMIIGMLLLLAFIIGFKLGERAVIMNQYIFEENCGNYFSEYNGQIHEYYDEYWHE